MLMLLIFLISSCLVFTSCAPKQPEKIIVPQVEYVFFIPEKVTIPKKPTFQSYDPKKSMMEKPNFTRLQQNTILMKNYANSLKTTVEHYEALIDKMKETKDKLEKGEDTSIDPKMNTLKKEVKK